MITKKPSAVVYGWYKLGNELLETDVYHEESLWDEVKIYSLPPILIRLRIIQNTDLT